MSEQLARLFHDLYERLAPQFVYETRTDTREFNPRSSNGRLMIAVCNEIRQQWLTEARRWLRHEGDCAGNARQDCSCGLDQFLRGLG